MGLPFTFVRKKRGATTERAPMDERLPDGQTVNEATADASEGGGVLSDVVQATDGFKRKRQAAPLVQQPQPTAPPPPAAPTQAPPRPLFRNFAEQPVETSADVPQTSITPQPLQTFRNEQGEDIAPIAPVSDATRPRFKTPPKVVYGENGRPERSIHSPDSVEREKAFGSAVQTFEPKEAKNWKERLMPLVLQYVLGGLRSGGVYGAAGGAIAGAITGLVDPKASDRTWKQREQAKSKTHLGELLGQQKADLDAQETRADIALKGANADYIRTVKPKEAEAKLGRQEQAAILATLARMKGIKLDPTSPLHADLIRRAQARGIPLEAATWNAAQDADAKNPFTLEITDPDDKTQKTRIALNPQTKQFERVTLGGTPVTTGFQAPRGADGLTEPERRGLGLREEGLGETKRHNRVTEGQSDERIKQGGERVLQGWKRVEQGDKRIEMSGDAQTRKEYGEARKLIERVNRAHIEADRHRAYKDKQGDADAAKWDAIADDLNEQLETHYGHLRDEVLERQTPAQGSSVHSTRSAYSPPPSSRFGGVAGAAGDSPKFSEQQIRDAAMRNGLDPNEAVRRARASGRLK